jgi:hypothetical protein
MFDKISTSAERLATNVSVSRRGFLARLGQVALGTAGAVAGVFAVSGQAHAGTYSGYCVTERDPGRKGSFFHTGYCVDPASCSSGIASSCRGGTVRRNSNSPCGTYDPLKPCSF